MSDPERQLHHIEVELATAEVLRQRLQEEYAELEETLAHHRLAYEKVDNRRMALQNELLERLVANKRAGVGEES